MLMWCRDKCSHAVSVCYNIYSLSSVLSNANQIADGSRFLAFVTISNTSYRITLLFIFCFDSAIIMLLVTMPRNLTNPPPLPHLIWHMKPRCVSIWAAACATENWRCWVWMCSDWRKTEKKAGQGPFTPLLWSIFRDMLINIISLYKNQISIKY